MYVTFSYQTAHILGLESLLKGDIQGDDNQLCRAEIQVSAVK